VSDAAWAPPWSSRTNNVAPRAPVAVLRPVPVVLAPEPPCDPWQRFSVLGEVLLADGATGTLDLTADARERVGRRADVERWRVGSLLVARADSPADLVLVATLAAGAIDLGHELVLGARQALEVGALLPPVWGGDLSVVLTNRTGASVSALVSVTFEPATR
jgi:hypothetical protein